MKFTVLALVFPFLFLSGCNKEEPTSAPSEPNTASSESMTIEPDTKEPETKPEQAPARKLVGGEMKDGENVAVMETTAGQIVLRFFPKVAPNTVDNFIKLAKKGFYEGIRFHRIIPGFMIQGGDPNSKSGDPMTWGSGGPGYNIKDELNDVKHEPGILSMAKTAAPDSGGSQFFIMVGTAPTLDRVHTAFGEVVKGMDVVDKIVQTPSMDPQSGAAVPDKAVVIKSVKIEKWPLKA
jgi:peptidyl-prolyl cis-trans isomerase B (cyclophilin B)